MRVCVLLKTKQFEDWNKTLKKTVFALWFDSNEELNDPFLIPGYQETDSYPHLISRPGSYIGTTNVVPDN